MKKAVFQNLENRMVTGDPGQNRTGDLPLRSRPDTTSGSGI